METIILIMYISSYFTSVNETTFRVDQNGSVLFDLGLLIYATSSSEHGSNARHRSTLNCVPHHAPLISRLTLTNSVYERCSSKLDIADKMATLSTTIYLSRSYFDRNILLRGSAPQQRRWSHNSRGVSCGTSGRSVGIQTTVVFCGKSLLRTLCIDHSRQNSGNLDYQCAALIFTRPIAVFYQDLV